MCILNSNVPDIRISLSFSFIDQHEGVALQNKGNTTIDVTGYYWVFFSTSLPQIPLVFFFFLMPVYNQEHKVCTPHYAGFYGSSSATVCPSFFLCFSFSPFRVLIPDGFIGDENDEDGDEVDTDSASNSNSDIYSFLTSAILPSTSTESFAPEVPSRDQTVISDKHTAINNSLSSHNSACQSSSEPPSTEENPGQS